MKYKIITTKDFDKRFDKLAKRNLQLAKQVIDTLSTIEKDPFYNGLKSHKVESKVYGEVYSSRITGDIRILWDFVETKPIILALTIGGHSGKNSVYK